MRFSNNFIGRPLFLIIVLLLPVNLFCSKKLYPEEARNLINFNGESSRLDAFIYGGIQKEVNSTNFSADLIISEAEKYLGVPHCMGGRSFNCMDCSGLISTVFAKFGINLPHNSEDQARFGAIVPEIEKLEKGDLVFFIRSYNTTRFITHSGIYLGNGTFIHSSSLNGVTVTSIFDSWWNEKFIFGTRLQ